MTELEVTKLHWDVVTRLVKGEVRVRLLNYCSFKSVDITDRCTPEQIEFYRAKLEDQEAAPPVAMADRKYDEWKDDAS